MIKERQLPIFAQKRYEICKQCEQYKNDTCGVFVAKGKSGYLFHEKGIINKRTRCPLRKFNSYRSLHSILISLFVRGLNDDESHFWTNNSITEANILDALYRLHTSDGLSRSEIKTRLELIVKYSNNYDSPKVAVDSIRERISLLPQKNNF